MDYIVCVLSRVQWRFKLTYLYYPRRNYRGDIYCMECNKKMSVKSYVESILNDWHMIYGKLCDQCYYGDID